MLTVQKLRAQLDNALAEGFDRFVLQSQGLEGYYKPIVCFPGHEELHVMAGAGAGPGAVADIAGFLPGFIKYCYRCWKPDVMTNVDGIQCSTVGGFKCVLITVGD